MFNAVFRLLLCWTLRDVLHVRYFQPAPALGLLTVQRPRSLHPRPMDMAAAFLFESSTSSEAEYESQTPTHTKDTDTTGYAGCRRQGAAFSSTHVQDLDKTEVETAKISSSSLAGKDWNSVVKAHIQRSRFTSKCMFRDPQILEWPFWPFYTPLWTFLPNSLSLHPPPAVCIVLLTPPPLRPSGLHSYLLLSPRFGCSFLMTCQLVWLTRLFPIIVSIMLVCQVCISRFCLLLPPSLVIPFHIKKVFDQMTLTKQMLSPST